MAIGPATVASSVMAFEERKIKTKRRGGSEAVKRRERKESTGFTDLVVLDEDGIDSSVSDVLWNSSLLVLDLDEVGGSCSSNES